MRSDACSKRTRREWCAYGTTRRRHVIKRTCSISKINFVCACVFVCAVCVCVWCGVCGVSCARTLVFFLVLFFHLYFICICIFFAHGECCRVAAKFYQTMSKAQANYQVVEVGVIVNPELKRKVSQAHTLMGKCTSHPRTHDA